jgi:hypothetical protein
VLNLAATVTFVVVVVSGWQQDQLIEQISQRYMIPNRCSAVM